MIPIHALALLLLPIQTSAQHGVSFHERAVLAGVNHDGWGRGVAAVDLDGDGLIDLYSTSATGPDAVFQQQPGPVWVDVTAAWGFVDDGRSEAGVVAADFDGDGDLDLYVPCGTSYGPQPDRLWRNDLDTLGVFTDVTAQAGDLAALDGTSFGATAFDYDRDGDLDLFVSNSSHATRPNPTNDLLRNDGNMVFTNVSVEAGIVHPGNFRHCGAGDMDGDGWIDIGVSDLHGDCLFYRNNGDGTFSEVHHAMEIVTGDANAFGVVFEDFNNDGFLDILIPTFRHRSRFYLNRQDGTFVDGTMRSGIRRHDVMGHNVGDLDMDGNADVFLGTGFAYGKERDVFYLTRTLNNGMIEVRDWSTKSGINAYGPTRCHGTAFADLNGDGFPDVYLGHGGPPNVSGSSQENALWVNDTNGNHTLTVRLKGTKSNLFGIGARVGASLPNGDWVWRSIEAGRGFCNTNEPAAFLGLGGQTAVSFLEIRWPSGLRQRTLVPAVDTEMVVPEVGLEVSGKPVVGGAVTFDVWGRPGDRVEIWTSTTPAWVLDPNLGGVLELGGNIDVLTAVDLGSDPHQAVNVTLPDLDTLIGQTLYVQAFFKDAGGVNKALSNRIDLPMLAP